MTTLLRIHDGERFCAAIEVGVGRKYRHVVLFSDRGVKLVGLPKEQPVEVLGAVKQRHLAGFRRVGKIFGITVKAEKALGEIA